MILCGIEFSRPLPSFFGMYSFSYLVNSTSLAFDPIFGAKAGGGVRESDFHADLALE